MVEAAAIYARISSDREGTQAGVGRQVEDCKVLAERRGWPVVEVYVDDDVSAFSGRVRPAYERMVEDITAGRVDAVVVWHHDRLHRRPKELEEFIELCDRAKLTQLASVSGDVDLSSPDALLTLRIMAAVASKESADKSRRIRRKHQELAQAGLPSGGGARPFGYEADKVTVLPGEAAVIREVAARLLAGDSLGSIARDLDERQVRTSTGKVWKTSMLRRTITSARISGQRENRGEIVGPAVWPAIITPEQTTQLRALFADPARKQNRAPRRYLLAGLLRCGRCGEVMVSRPRAGGARAYICRKDPGFPGCGHMYVTADPVESLIAEAVLYRLDSPELAAALTAGDDGPDSDLQAALEADDEQLKVLARLHANNEIGLSEWLEARKVIETRMTAAKRTLSRNRRTTVLDGFVGNSDTLRQQWAGLTLSRQQGIVKAVLDHAVVNSEAKRSSRFDPGRVVPVWRL